MNTYKVNVEWNTFNDFIVEDLSEYRNELGVMYRSDEIYQIY